jgi:predicted PurR-regulated permease PerM
VQVSRYLVYRTAINIGLGMTAWLVFVMVDLPDAGMWATVSAVFNFVPYLGAFCAFCLIALASLLAFDSVSMASVAPLAFGALTTIEGFIVSPLIFGGKLKINPVVVLLGLIFWGWLWGIPGALMAVPLIVCMRIVFERLPSMRAFGELITKRRDKSPIEAGRARTDSSSD